MNYRSERLHAAVDRQPPSADLVSCLGRLAAYGGLGFGRPCGNIAVACVALRLSPLTAPPRGHQGYCQVRPEVSSMTTFGEGCEGQQEGLP